MPQRSTLPECVRRFAAIGIAFVVLVAAAPSHAVPSFARQTGFECVSCHLSWPELTSVGREFKLGGYTLTKESHGDRPWVSLNPEGLPPLLPLAAMVQVSYNRTRSTAGEDPSEFPRDSAVALQQASLFYAGRVA